MATTESSRNMYDVLPEAEPIFAEHQLQHWVLGGASTQAMIYAATMSDRDNTIWPQSDLELNTIRENGTVRDVDFLVGTTDPERLDALHADVSSEIGEYAVVSVFGFDRHAEVTGRSALKAALSDFTSRRTVSEDGESTYYVCDPVVHEVDANSYEPWTVQLANGKQFTTLSPVAHQAAYNIRSLGGVRPRDREKIAQMEQTMGMVWPNYSIYRDERVGEWYEFGEHMRDIGLSEHGARSLAAANRQRLIGFLDGQGWAVDIAQGGGFLGEKIQPILGKFMREASSESEEEKPEREIGELEARYIEYAQKVSEATNGILTPGNVLSTMSLIVTASGYTHLDDLAGVAKIAAGEAIDLADGPAARHSKTASKLGATVDATFDKMKMAFGLYMGARKGVIPAPVAAEIAAQNIANAGMTLYGEAKGIDLNPSIEGKHTRFYQITSMASFMMAGALEGRSEPGAQAAAKALRAAGWGTFAYQLKTGYKATKGYYEDFVRDEVAQEELELIQDPAEKLFPFAA